MNLLPMLVIGVVVAIFSAVAILGNTDDFEDGADIVKSNALKKIASFGDSGERIEFDLDPLPMSQEFIWVNEIIQVPIISVDENGEQTITVTNKTVQKQVPVAESELYVELRDKQTGDTKVCKQGNECEFTGRIVLVDPVSGVTLSPVIYSYIVKCVDAVTLHCNNFSTRSDTQLGYTDSTFKFVIPFDKNVPTGMYLVTVGADSKYKVYNPITQLEEYVRRTATLDVNVIP